MTRSQKKTTKKTAREHYPAAGIVRTEAGVFFLPPPQAPIDASDLGRAAEWARAMARIEKWPAEWLVLLGRDATDEMHVQIESKLRLAKTAKSTLQKYADAVQKRGQSSETITAALGTLHVDVSFLELQLRGRRTKGRGRTVDPRRGRILARLLSPYRPKDWPDPSPRDLALFSLAAGVVPNGRHKTLPALLDAETRAMRIALKELKSGKE